VKPREWLREPLVHFLVAGAALYLGASLVSPGPREDSVIVIGEDELLADLQQRSQTTDRAMVREALRTMPKEQRAELAHDAAVQEALYREGQALGLDTVDPLIRLRTIQQMRLLLTEEAAAGMTVSEAEVAEYYRANRADYAEPAAASFGHIYFRGADGEARARAALARLRGGQALAEDLGDRFLYQANYSDTGAEEIAAEFGRGFAESLFGLDSGKSWQGPLKSDHGWHLVQLRGKQPARVPPLADIEGRVHEDALAAKRGKAAEAAMEELLENYEVRVR